MKKLVLVAVFVIGFSIVAVAQEERPAYQFFGGYSSLQQQFVYFRAEQRTAPEGYFIVKPPDKKARTQLNGWNISLAINGKKWLAFITDFSGYYGKVGSPYLFEVSYLETKYPRPWKSHSLLFGPKLSITAGKFTPYIQTLFGDIHTNLGGHQMGATSTAQNAVKRETLNSFGFALGAGLDVAVNKKFGVRALQAEYVSEKYGTNQLQNIRVSSGMIYYFGKHYQ